MDANSATGAYRKKEESNAIILFSFMSFARREWQIHMKYMTIIPFVSNFIEDFLKIFNGKKRLPFIKTTFSASRLK